MIKDRAGKPLQLTSRPRFLPCQVTESRASEGFLDGKIDVGGKGLSSNSSGCWSGVGLRLLCVGGCGAMAVEGCPAHGAVEVDVEPAAVSAVPHPSLLKLLRVGDARPGRRETY